MEKRIKRMWKIMSIVLILSVLFFAVSANGLFSLSTGIAFFIAVTVGYKNAKNKWGDERELYLYMAQSMGALLFGLSFMFMYMGYAALAGFAPAHLFEYSILAICLGQITFFKLLKGKNHG